MTFQGINVSTILFAGVAAIWLGFLVMGRIQIKKVKERTVKLVLSEVTVELEKNPHLEIDSFYNLIYPKWCQMLKSTALFVPNPTELWPMPANPNYVKNRIKFSPEVVGRFLANNEIFLEGVEIEKEVIEPNNDQSDLRKPTYRLVKQICRSFKKKDQDRD